METGVRAKVQADATPLVIALTSMGQSHVITRPSERRLVLKASPVVRGFFYVLIAFGAIVMAVPWKEAHRPGLLAILPMRFFSIETVGLVMAGLGVLALALLRRHEFDLDDETLRVKRFFFLVPQTRFLADILAIQVLQGPWETRAGQGSTGIKRSFATYQLNLVLADPNEPRVNLTNRDDGAATLRSGRQIAEFLGIPLLDLLSDGLDQAATPGVPVKIRSAELIAEVAARTGIEPETVRRGVGALFTYFHKALEPEALDRFNAAIPDANTVLDDYQIDPGDAPIGLAGRVVNLATFLMRGIDEANPNLAMWLRRAGLADDQVGTFLDAALERLKGALPVEYRPAREGVPPSGDLAT